MDGAKALQQVLDRSEFNYEKDLLIQLGDIVDGWNEVFECFEILNKIENKILIRGNHDQPFLHFIECGVHPWYWQQGGEATFSSYFKHNYSGIKKRYEYITNLDVPASHQKMLKDQHYYYVDNRNWLFIHGGFDRHEIIEVQDPDALCWNRKLWNEALSCSKGIKLGTIDCFEKIFIGHTATTNWKQTSRWINNPDYNKDIDFPMYSGGVWNIDTGAGWRGKLSMMNISNESDFITYQSDPVQELYKDQKGRN